MRKESQGAGERVAERQGGIVRRPSGGRSSTRHWPRETQSLLCCCCPHARHRRQPDLQLAPAISSRSADGRRPSTAAPIGRPARSGSELDARGWKVKTAEDGDKHLEQLALILERKPLSVSRELPPGVPGSKESPEPLNQLAHKAGQHWHGEGENRPDRPEGPEDKGRGRFHDPIQFD